MGMTMTQKILAKHAHRDSVSAGDLLVSQVDLVLANDITGPPAINEFEKIGKPVFDKNKIALVPDHFSPCKDIKSATMCKRMRDFARKHEIKNYFEVGQMGIEHALLPDKGLVAPGEIIIGADSHTWHLRRAQRTKHRHGPNRYRLRYGQRHLLVQGSAGYQSQPDRQAAEIR